MDQYNAAVFVLSSIAEGVAIGCFLTTLRSARPGQRILPIVSLAFVLLVIILHLTFAVSLFIRSPIRWLMRTWAALMRAPYPPLTGGMRASVLPSGITRSGPL